MAAQVVQPPLGRQLAQSRPSGTSAVSIYSPGAFYIAQINYIVIANTTGSTAYFSLFHDEDGTTYNETTTVAWQIDIATQASNVATIATTAGLWMNGANGGNFAVLTETGSALTFTLYGIEYKVK